MVFDIEIRRKIRIYMSAGERKIGFGQIEGKKTRIIYVKREKGNLSSTDSFQEIKDSICKKRKNKFVADR